MLLEGASFDDYGTSSISVAEANEITLETGAAIIARKTASELHELFELSIVATNEAALAAYMEGCTDVAESATYGPVFEASEKSFGKRVIDVLLKLKDRVIAFFRDIFTKLSELLNNYDKFFNKNVEAMTKAESKRGGGVKNVKVKAWNDNAIDGVSEKLNKAADIISKTASDMILLINETYKKANDAEKSEAAHEYANKKLNTLMDEKLATTLKSLGISVGAAGLDTTEINSACQKVFYGDGTRTITLTTDYCRTALVGVKKAAGEVKTAQKSFNSAYDKAISNIKGITKEMEREDAKGYTAYINKATSTISKVQTVMNAYATAGYRALIGRANEAKSLCHVVISGKPGNRKDNDAATAAKKNK